MADRRLLKLTFEGGLLEGQEDAVRPAGYAHDLVNWVPGVHGGCRARVGWRKSSAVGAPTDGRAKGIGSFSRLTSPSLVQWVQNDIQSSAVSATWPTATTPGSLLVMVLQGSSGGTLAVNTVPAGWVLACSKVDEGFLHTYVYYKEAAPSESGLVTVTFNTSGTTSMTLLEYTGILGVSSVDVFASDWYSSSMSNTVQATSTQDSSLIIGTSVSRDYRYKPTCTSGLRLIDDDFLNGTWDFYYGIWDNTVTEAGVQTFTTTYTYNVENQNTIIVFKGWNTDPSPEVFAQRLLVANKGIGDVDIYACPLELGDWVLLDTITTTENDHAVDFVSGLGKVWYTSPGWANGRSYDGVAARSESTLPAARALEFHKERIWAGGTNANPTALFYSESGNALSWPSSNFLYIGRDDGEFIEDIAVFQDGLLIAKANSVWYLTGNTPSTFRLSRLEKGGGAEGRCICSTPYGAIIVTDGAVYMWTGSGLDLISRPIERNFGLVSGPVYTLYHDNVLYIHPSGNSYSWAFDFTTGVWWRELTAGYGRIGPLFDYRKRIYGGLVNATDKGLISYRDIPYGSRDRDETLAESFIAETSEVWPVGPDKRVTPLHLHVRVKQRGGNSAHAPIIVTPYYNGEAYPTHTIEPREPGTWRERLDVGHAEGINSVKFRFEQDLPVDHLSVFDIDEVKLDLKVEERA